MCAAWVMPLVKEGSGVVNDVCTQVLGLCNVGSKKPRLQNG